MTNKRHLAYAALLLNTVIWGAALPIVKPALDLVSPYQYLFYRYLVAIPFSIPVLIFLLLKYKPSLRTIATIVCLESIAITGALSFLYEGLKRTSSIEASFIANTAPIFITIGGVLFLKEKEELHELAGLIIAVAGVSLLALEPLVTGHSGLSNLSFRGNLIILGHNFLWAIYLLLAKKHYKSVPKLLVGFISLWVGFISFYFITLFHNPAFISFPTLLSQLSPTPVLTAALYMGLLGSVIAVPAYIYGNNAIEASEASLFGYLQPLIYIPLATLWLKEPFTLLMLIALTIAAIGVFIAEGRSHPQTKAKSIKIKP